MNSGRPRCYLPNWASRAGLWSHDRVNPQISNKQMGQEAFARSWGSALRPIRSTRRSPVPPVSGHQVDIRAYRNSFPWPVGTFGGSPACAPQKARSPSRIVATFSQPGTEHRIATGLSSRLALFMTL